MTSRCGDATFIALNVRHERSPKRSDTAPRRRRREDERGRRKRMKAKLQEAVRDALFLRRAQPELCEVALKPGPRRPPPAVLKADL